MIFFPDSNIFIHFQPIENWIHKDKPEDFIKVGLCHCIISELDKIKYSSSSNIVRRRGQGIIKKFSASSNLLFNNIPFTIYMPGDLQSVLTNNSLDKNDKDDLFIASVLKYKEDNPNEGIKIVTNDLGIQLKCKAFEISFVIPAEQYLFQEDSSAEKEIQRLNVELNKIKNLQPKLFLQFDNQETYKPFDIRKMWIGDEDAIEEELSEIRKEYPLLEPTDPQDKKKLFLDFYERTPEKVAKFNFDLEKFYVDYKTYLRRSKIMDYKESLSIILNIELVNNGTTPAQDIDLYMHFPNGFTLVEKAEYYKREIPPIPPNPSFYSLAPMDELSLFPSLIHPKLPKINHGGLSIKKTNSYEVKEYFKTLKHNHLFKIDPIYVVFETLDDARGFEIEYTISAGNLINNEEGKLHVTINKIDELNFENEDNDHGQ